MEHRVARSEDDVISPSCSERQNARLTVRPLAIDDLDGIVAYFTKLSQADAERMGLDLNRADAYPAT